MQNSLLIKSLNYPRTSFKPWATGVKKPLFIRWPDKLINIGIRYARAAVMMSARDELFQLQSLLDPEKKGLEFPITSSMLNSISICHVPPDAITYFSVESVAGDRKKTNLKNKDKLCPSVTAFN